MMLKLQLFISLWSCFVVKAVSDVPPIVDVSPLILDAGSDLSSEAMQATLTEIKEAMIKWGFFYIQNFGIGDDILRELKQQSVDFFNSPAKYSIRRALNNSRGFADDEYTKQLMDNKEIFDMGHVPNPSLPSNHQDNIVLDGHNQWPESHTTSFRNIVESYYENCAKLSRRLLALIARNLLNDSDNVVSKAFDQHTSLFRLNYYPISNDSYDLINSDGNSEHTTKLGISRHTDAGVLTLLLQDQAGLEVYSGSKEDNHDGIWVPVDPVPNTLTVNVGDMLQVWSNGLFKAAEHRVRRSTTDVRYTAAFFLNPSYDTVVGPLHIRDQERSRYRPIQWGYFRRQRFLGDYADFGKEIQIEDFIIRDEDMGEEKA
jgi:isopenicillin N synthase-like dioxygenase